MKKSIILINKSSFVFNNQEYNFDRINEVVDLFKPRLKIVILEENLYVKQFHDKVKKHKMYELVNNKINNNFPQTGDLLYDFEKKNNIIVIYSIKGAKRIEKLSIASSFLEIKPIQFIIKEVMQKILKRNNFNADVVVKLNEFYYFTCFKKGLFNYGFVNDNEELILNEINDSEEIYIDNNVFDIFSSKNKIKIIKLNIGDLINEKIYEKQKFYSGKILL
ncbi:hypothetical protein CDLVIII_3152 [Clostridium sp. DL-VIII]|uniref:hypothetical protein n=1 Tax=Clostridium sp. DL-VIII TaxID=641107 RepID=UPI00023AFF30|nr:hypothetical protein [Clostridium sp. DL-VIII]EHI99728.1 hypothetical protein CDLVIII_3152 [Clostridium sp. DL-VIII]